MLSFEESFFQGESRAGFYIDPMMKKAWAVQLEVLSQVSRICRKYDIPYYAVYGTLLGAVRHKGYIPWDDDIDIALKRPDYVRLMKLFTQELPEGYYVHSYYTDESHVSSNSAVLNTKYVMNDAEKIQKFWGCPYVCGIDIFPLDYVSNDPEEDSLQKQLYQIVFSVAHDYAEYEASGELHMFVAQIEKMCGVTLDDDGTLRRQLFLLAEKISGLYEERECDSLTINSSRYGRNDPNFRFPKEWFASTREIPFENIQVSVPVESDKALRVFYGDDYMTPVRCGGGHEYPFFKKQQRFLDENHIVLPCETYHIQ